jgi:hypothetical protein
VNISASAKLLLGAHQVDHLLVAIGRDGKQLDLSLDHHMELVARLADAKHHVASREGGELAARRQRGQLRRRHRLEERQHRKVAGDVERGADVHGGLPVEGRWPIVFSLQDPDLSWRKPQ